MNFILRITVGCFYGVQASACVRDAFMVFKLCDKNGNQSGIHADAHDVVSHTGDLLDQKKIQVTCSIKKNTGDLQVTRMDLKPTRNSLGHNPLSDALHRNPGGDKWARAGSPSPQGRVVS